jgi:hypothetical protein
MMGQLSSSSPCYSQRSRLWRASFRRAAPPGSILWWHCDTSEEPPFPSDSFGNGLSSGYVYDYLVFFNINICRNNLADVKMLTEYAHDHRIATDYHINETPMLEQHEHFKHLSENPTYFRPEDWGDLDNLIDGIIDKNKAGYQMVNSCSRSKK